MMVKMCQNNLVLSLVNFVNDSEIFEKWLSMKNCSRCCSSGKMASPRVAGEDTLPLATRGGRVNKIMYSESRRVSRRVVKLLSRHATATRDAETDFFSKF